MQAARLLADTMYLTDPKRAKHQRKVWGKNDPAPPSFYGFNRELLGPAYFILDYEPEFYPLDEQLELAAQAIKKLGRFQFLLRPAIREGEVSEAVFPITIADLDRDPETGSSLFPQEAVLSRVRHALAAAGGMPIDRILTAQQSRLGGGRTQELPSPPARTIQRRERLS